jgi:hypothetical protein
MSALTIQLLPLAVALGVLIAAVQDRWRRWSKLRRDRNGPRAFNSGFYNGGSDAPATTTAPPVKS